MQDQQTISTTTVEAWLSLPLALSPQAERLTGANHEPMLYLGAEQRYIRLSQGAARLVDALDGGTTAEQILARVSGGGDPVLAERRRRTVLGTIDGLRRAGAFTIDAGGDRRSGQGRWTRWMARTPKLRVTGRIDSWVARPTALAQRHRLGTSITLSGLALVSVALTIAGVLHFPAHLQVVWPLVPAVLLVEVAVHELGHAAVCRSFGVRVREAGVILWGWFLPLAYVDCTDIYRLPARRPRVMVALAGPYVDLVAAGAFSLVALAGHGAVSGTAFMVLIFQVLVLARNVTPLLPTDGYHALEAATGELNLRRRSSLHLRAGLGRLVPRHLSRQSMAGQMEDRHRRTRREKVYVAYGAISAVYTVAMLALVVSEVRDLVGAIG